MIPTTIRDVDGVVGVVVVVGVVGVVIDSNVVGVVVIVIAAAVVAAVAVVAVVVCEDDVVDCCCWDDDADGGDNFGEDGNDERRRGEDGIPSRHCYRRRRLSHHRPSWDERGVHPFGSVGSVVLSFRVATHHPLHHHCRRRRRTSLSLPLHVSLPRRHFLSFLYHRHCHHSYPHRYDSLSFLSL